MTSGPEGEATTAVPDPSSTRTGTWVSLTCLVLFVALTALVVSGAVQPLDERILERLRPGDAWGESQVRYSPWMHWLRPTRMFVLLACVSAAAAVRSRSWRPLVGGLALGWVSAALVLLVKLALERPDPHGAVASSGGSYPSGHIVAVLVCLGGCLLVLGAPVRSWWWGVPAVGAALMTASLVVSAAHWPSDVAGGALLALAVLAAGRRWVGMSRAR